MCLAYQSCENNRVCVASSLSRWSIISGPSERMAQAVCVDHDGIWVEGNTPGWHCKCVSFNTSDGSHDRANKTQNTFKLGIFLHICGNYNRQISLDEVLKNK